MFDLILLTRARGQSHGNDAESSKANRAQNRVHAKTRHETEFLDLNKENVSSILSGRGYCPIRPLKPG